MKLVSKRRLTKNNDPIDSLQRRRNSFSKQQLDILYRAQGAWDGLSKMRTNRDRLLKFTFGDQFCDLIRSDCGTMREREWWAKQGVIPKKNNLIRKMVRSVIGVFKNQDSDFSVIALDRDEQAVGEMMSVTLQANRQANRMNELEMRMFEEFIISATCFCKESWGWRRNREDTWTDIVSPEHIFFDGTMQDVRHWDCDVVGQIHDISFNELCERFAKTQDDFHTLRAIYTNARDENFISSRYANVYQHRRVVGSFFLPLDSNMCRVIEVWSKEQKPRYRCHDYATGEWYKIEENELDQIKAENGKRIQQAASEGIPEDEIPFIEATWFIDSYWYYRFLTPLGDVLQEGETPFKHGDHPYTIKIHPFIDGKPYSMVEDAIDQQKFINEMITLYTLMAKHSAKGLLMFPEQLMPEGMSPEDIANEWSRVNGMIVFHAKQGVPLPQQLSTNVSNFSINEMLRLQMGLFEEVTGVTGALQGKAPPSGTAAAMFAQMTQNATTTLTDVLFSFGNFMRDATIKKLSNIQQFYTEQKTIVVAGAQYKGLREYMPHLAKDIELDVNVVESPSNPAYRTIANEYLVEMWRAGSITVKQLLEVGAFPFADELLASMKAEEEAAAAAQEAQGLEV